MEPETPIADDEGPGRRPWLAVASVAVGTFAMVTTEFLPIGLLGPIASDLGVSDGAAGLLVTVPGLVAAAAAPTALLVLRDVDRRTILLGLSGLLVAANVVVALAPALPVVLLGRILLGLSVGGFWTFAAAVGRRLVDGKDGGRATSLVLTGISVGTVVGVPLGTALGALAGWRAAFGAVAALSLVVLVAQSALLPQLPSHGGVAMRDIASLVRVRFAAVGLLAAALIACGHFAAYTYLEPFLAGTVRLGPTGVSWTLGAYGLAGVAGTFSGERGCARDVRVTFAVVAAAIGLTVLFPAIEPTAPGPAVLAVVAWGAAFGAVPVCVQTWLHEAAPDRFEAGSALMVTVFQVALATGAWVGGVMLDGFGLPSAFALGGTLSLLCAAVVIVAGRRRPAALPPSTASI